MLELSNYLILIILTSSVNFITCFVIKLIDHQRIQNYWNLNLFYGKRISEMIIITQKAKFTLFNEIGVNIIILTNII